MKIKLLLFLICFTSYAQRATHGSLNVGQLNQIALQRMIPYSGGNIQQTQIEKKIPLRAHNNRYPANKSNIMQFGPYKRTNLRDSKKRAEAIKLYKEKLSAMRINLRAYRIEAVKPIEPVAPPKPKPKPQPQPQPPNTGGPNNGGGEIGIGGGPGPVPPSFPPAVGMPAPQPR